MIVVSVREGYAEVICSVASASNFPEISDTDASHTVLWAEKNKNQERENELSRDMSIVVRDPHGSPNATASQVLTKYRASAVIQASANNIQRGLDEPHLWSVLGDRALTWWWGGFSATVLAYGPSRTGKSFSLFGDGNGGQVHKILVKLFERIENCVSDVTLAMSCWELKRDSAVDLLHPSGTSNARVATRRTVGNFVSVRVRDLLASQTLLAMARRRSANNDPKAHNKLKQRSNRAHLFLKFVLHNERNNALSELNIVDLVGFRGHRSKLLDGDSTSTTSTEYTHYSSMRSLGSTSTSSQDAPLSAHASNQQQLDSLRVLLADLSRGGDGRASTRRLSGSLAEILRPMITSTKTFFLATVSSLQLHYTSLVDTLRLGNKVRTIPFRCRAQHTDDWSVAELIAENDILSFDDQRRLLQQRRHKSHKVSTSKPTRFVPPLCQTQCLVLSITKTLVIPFAMCRTARLLRQNRRKLVICKAAQ